MPRQHADDPLQGGGHTGGRARRMGPEPLVALLGPVWWEEREVLGWGSVRDEAMGVS